MVEKEREVELIIQEAKIPVMPTNKNDDPFKLLRSTSGTEKYIDTI